MTLPRVTFGGVPAAVLSASRTQIVCLAPPHASGAVDVSVQRFDGASATLINGYTYADFTPGDVGQLRFEAYHDVGTWKDAARMMPAGINDPVYTWDNQQSGAGSFGHALQPSAGNRLIKTVDGLHCADLSRLMQISGVSLTSFTCFCVALRATDDQGPIFYSQGGQLSSGTGMNLSRGSAGGIQITVRKTGAAEDFKYLTSGAPIEGTMRSMRHSYDGTAAGHTLWFNGVQQTMTDDGPQDHGLGAITSDIYLGYIVGAAVALPGYYKAYLVYSPVLSLVDAALVDTYLINRFSL